MFAAGRSVGPCNSPHHPPAATRGQLRDIGYEPRSVADELRANLIDRLRSGSDAFPGIVGFDDTVLPELESALLAGHDLVLLGERGQGKTRLMRTLSHAARRVDPRGRPAARSTTSRTSRSASAAAPSPLELGDDLPISWRHRDDRYTEKLATPDTSVGDLIGDVDPVKVAQGRTLGDPETVHYGLVPRANRGVFGLNELPDLAERIQVALFNVLEERDIQVRGYSLRLPLDVFLIATANPEDYTNRGRIITPLKDRFGAEIRTHYLTELPDEVALLRQEAELVAEVGDHLLEVLARFTRSLRESSSVDQRSGVSARFTIAAAEAVGRLGPAAGRPDGDAEAVARVGDLPAILPTLLGKIEFEMGEEGRERAVLDHLLRLAIATTFRDRLGGLDLSGFTSRVRRGCGGRDRRAGARPRELLAQLGTVPGLAKVLDRLGYHDGATPGQVAAAAEFVLEGLHLTRRIDKDTVGGRTIYGAA